MPMKARVITLMADVPVNRAGWVPSVLISVQLVALGCCVLCLVTVALTGLSVPDLVIISPVHAFASQASMG